MDDATTERIAREFHEVYERLAPEYGWKSQTPVAWDHLPLNNKLLMLAVVRELPWIKEQALKLHQAESDRAQLQHALENVKLESAGWRSCIDHIIKPSDPCPVCRLDAMRTIADERAALLSAEIAKTVQLESRLDRCRSALMELDIGHQLGDLPRARRAANEIASALIAQLAEHDASNVGAAGSSPAERSIIADGFGGQWARCEREHQCGLQVVRPGKAACCLDPDECPRGGSLVQIVGVVETSLRFDSRTCPHGINPMEQSCPQCDPLSNLGRM